MTAMTVPPPPPPPSVWTIVVSLSRSGSVMGKPPVVSEAQRCAFPPVPATAPGGSGFGQEIRDREIALAGIVIEGEDALAGADLVELLADRRQARARADADQHAFLARRPPRHLLGVGRIDQDDPVDRVGVEIGGNEAGADALDRVRAGLATGDDRGQGRLDREHTQAPP